MTNEWRLLQSLSSLLGGRLSRTFANDQRGQKRRDVHVHADSFEWELRSIVLKIRTCVLQNAPNTEYAEFEAQSKSFCRMLNSLVSIPSSLRLRKQQRSPRLEENPIYPRLVELEMALKHQSPDDQSEFDLAYGLNETLFRIPQDSVLRDHLQVATEYDELLTKLQPLQSQQPSLQPPPPMQKKPEKDPWKTARLRDRAIMVLDSIFNHFSCKGHQVLLKLAEEPEENDEMTPTLCLSLSACPTSKIWQEAICGQISSSPNMPIRDLCLDLQRNINPRMALELMLEDSKLYGSWAHLCGSDDASSSKESLHNLISNGAFRISFNNFDRNRSAVKFGTQDKGALVVKLGYCLMDFFETGMTSERIFFQDLVRPDSGNVHYIPYLRFGPEPPLSIDRYRYSFTAENTALPSFAKLLLEVYYGETIDLDINTKNVSEVWGKLMKRVNEIETLEPSGPYLEAVRNCLQAHLYIAGILTRPEFDLKIVNRKIRRALYKRVVSKLQLGLAASIPRSRSDGKRKRSDSPPRRPVLVHSETAHNSLDGGLEGRRVRRERHVKDYATTAGNTGWGGVNSPTRPGDTTRGYKQQCIQSRQQNSVGPGASPHEAHRGASLQTRNPVYPLQHLGPAQSEIEPRPGTFDERSVYNPVVSMGVTRPIPGHVSSVNWLRNVDTRSNDLFIEAPLGNEGFFGKFQGSPSDQQVRQGDSLEWENEFKRLTQRCIPRLTNYEDRLPMDRLKIAILDTGIDYGHSHFAGSTKIKEVRSFVEDNTDGKIDYHGHGTSIAGIVLDLTQCIDVEIYIGKVASSDKTNPDKSAIVKGLTHAADEWKVNMISLSFGFQNPIQAISDKVTECLNRGISIFAAASNEAGNNDATFPANMSRVFCIHAASGAGNKYTHNPHPSPYLDWNFMTLGWDIKCTCCRPDQYAPPGRNPDPSHYVSGTSFAAPVAMCIAAFMVDYIRNTMDCSGFHIRPNCPEGLQKIFREMMSHEPDYHRYISPFAYFQKNKWDNSLIRGRISLQLRT